MWYVAPNDAKLHYKFFTLAMHVAKYRQNITLVISKKVSTLPK